jgi:heterodisulfide reductase subunit A
MAAIKHAMMIRQEQNPNAEIYIYYLDMRCFGKGYEEYYKRASEEGIKFIRSKIANIEVGEGLEVKLEDADLGEVIALKPDLVVLSTGLVPSEGSEELAKTLRLSLDANNFFSERHPKLAPVDTNTDGIFICGCAQGPKDIPDTVAQARAAAVGAATPILKREITIDLAKAEVDTELCDGCGTCAELCPYHAVQLSEGTKPVAEVIEMVCKSCGTCAAGCPTGAMQLRHYKLDQLFAQIEGVCGGK